LENSMEWRIIRDLLVGSGLILGLSATLFAAVLIRRWFGR
jgi:hypothetical protein